ncbi:MAG: hypothetical protein RBR66_01895 [Candidatus Izemoplasmatales bacterium]|jgi:hypothetical protein|nr:hypothetical protein [Candidatus Izemoplasmatales bacterium]
MDKEDKDIRKEIEELEKLIEQVKEQNKEEKKKQKKSNGPNGQIVIKVNLGMEYSKYFLLNLLISFIVNFLIIFALTSILSSVVVANVIYVIFISLILTLYEELYRKYLVKHFINIVIYSSGLIYFLMNLLLFYFLDLVIFGNNFYFISNWDPLLFVMLLHILRIIVRTLYLNIVRKIKLSKIKRRR